MLLHWKKHPSILNIEKLLKKKRGGKDRGPEAEPIPSADSPETELPLDGPAPADPPRQGSAEERVRIKTREATAQRPEGPRRASTEKSNPSSSAYSVIDKPSHVRTEPPKIKTREYIRQDAFTLTHRGEPLPPAESPAPEKFLRSRIQDIRQIFRRGEPSILSLRQEAAPSQPKASQMPPLPKRATRGTSDPKQFPAIKTNTG